MQNKIDKLENMDLDYLKLNTFVVSFGVLCIVLSKWIDVYFGINYAVSSYSVFVIGVFMIACRTRFILDLFLK